MRALFFGVLFLFFINELFGQKLTGQLSSGSGKLFSTTNLLFRETDSTSSIREYVIVRGDRYTYELTLNYNILVIEVVSNGHQSKFFTINNPIKDSVYQINFSLDTIKTYNLVPITIVAQQAITVKEDTIVYNVASFSKGDERKVEDLLKKLPGITVDERTGTIKFKGKSVETVLLEGDNLFGSNYTIGTRNINIGIIEQIEAIENYSENALLKGIEQSDKVVLNLKLRSGMIDLSGNIEAGIGINRSKEAVKNFNGSLMTVSKKVKSFNTLSINNVGINQSPFDFFSSQFDMEKLNEEEYLAKKPIAEFNLSNFLDESRNNINDIFYSSSNTIFKLSKRFTFKANIDYLHDNIVANTSLNSTNKFGTHDLLYTNDLTIRKKPVLFKADFHAQYNLSKNSLIEYKYQNRKDVIVTSGESLSNDSIFSTYTLSSEERYLRHSMLYTKKLSKNSALQFHAQNLKSSINQNYRFSPSVINPDTLAQDNQEVSVTKYVTATRMVFFDRGNIYKYHIGLALDRNSYDFRSGLTGLSRNNGEYINSNSNSTNYEKSLLTQFSNFYLMIGRLQINTRYTLNLMDQNLRHLSSDPSGDNQNLYIEPSIGIKYSMAFNSFLLGMVSHTRYTKIEDFVYTSPILVNNRSLVSGLPQLDLQKATSYRVAYRKSNIEEQSQFDLSLSYLRKQGNYFVNALLSERFTNLTYFYSEKKVDNALISLFKEKFVSIAQSTLGYRASFNVEAYHNVINNSGLRNITANTFANHFYISTAFDIPVNFRNETFINLSNSYTEVTGKIENTYFNNSLSLVAKPLKRVLCTISADYFLPNTAKRTEDFMFIDFLLNYKAMNKRFEVTLVANNLLDNKFLLSTQTNDYSINVVMSNLLRSYYLINLTCNF